MLFRSISRPANLSVTSDNMMSKSSTDTAVADLQLGKTPYTD